MANKKSGKRTDKRKKSDSRKKSNGSAEIKRAEQRLSKALADVDDAREKAQRRERELAKLMARHGHPSLVLAAAGDAIPLEAPAQGTSANGANYGGEAAGVELAEQLASSEGDEHQE